MSSSTSSNASTTLTLEHFRARETTPKAAERESNNVETIKLGGNIFEFEKNPRKSSWKEQLIWRLDPEESFSDWTIEITVEASEDIYTFHVHKSYLATGLRKSEYFVRLFSQAKRFSESKTETSKIQLNRMAAEAFPVMLDWVYAVGDNLKVSTENATALHFLGEYFENPRLRWESQFFWKTDMSVQNWKTYYEHAKLFKDELILAALTRFSIDHIEEFSTDSDITRITDTDFWLDVLIEVKLCESKSRHAGELLSIFLQGNSVDAETFEAITCSEVLPHSFDLSVALKLLDLEMRIVEPSRTALTDLQYRCISSISDEWIHFREDKGKSVMNLLQKKNPLLLTELTCMIVMKATEDLVSAKMEYASTIIQDDLSVFDARRDVECQVVLGAGKTSVNGVYGKVGQFNNASRYAKVRKGHDDTFYIYQRTLRNSSTGAKQWCIAMVPEWNYTDWSVPEGSETIYYTRMVTNDCHDEPPSQGWMREGLGCNPAPRLLQRQASNFS